MMTDPHDRRQFRQWVSLDDEGNVIATHEFEASIEQPLRTVVDVTVLGPQDWTNPDPQVLTIVRAEQAALNAKIAADAIAAIENALADTVTPI